MIESPPKINNQNPTELNSEPLQAVLTKINNQYLYWSDVKYRTNGLDISPEQLWKCVKQSRRNTDIKIWDFDDIHFALTNSMQRLYHQFDMNFGGCSWGASKIFPDDKHTQELYLVSSIMEEAIASSQIEGAATTREAAKEMLRKKISPKDKSQQMIVNNYHTINFIREHAHEELTPELIMQIHGMMTENALDIPDAAGRFRRDEENIVVGDGITGETVHTPPSADILPAFITKLCAFFNEREPDVFIHPILRAIIIHFLIGYYHPFADGNGRTARALFYWYMMRSNYWFIQYMSISRVIKGTKKAYEKAYLYAERDGNDMGYFIQYNLNVLHKSFEELKKYLIRKNREKKKSERLLRLGDISPRQAQILSQFVDNPNDVVTSVDLIGKYGISAGTAKSDLKKLSRLGYLSEISLNGRTKGYVKSESMDAMIKLSQT